MRTFSVFPFMLCPGIILTDDQMISRMARENSARRKFDTSVLREAIGAAVNAHGKGLILPSEMPIDSKTNTSKIRYAPAFMVSATDSVAHPYTIETLAKFLGFVKSGNQEPTNSFITAFGAEELIADGVLKASQIKGFSAERLGELVIAVRKQRDAARAEAVRLAGESVKRAKGPRQTFTSCARALPRTVKGWQVQRSYPTE
jgi:hypothetical protein